MKRILYLGTDPTSFESDGQVVHFPVIQVIPRSYDHPELKAAYDDLERYTHVIFTSKNAVRIFKEHLDLLGKRADLLAGCYKIAIGAVTAERMEREGMAPQAVSTIETQEGVVALLKGSLLEDAYIFLPRSSLSRPILVNYFDERNIRYRACDLYDTVKRDLFPLPDLNTIDEIVFTSPSTVRAFVEIFGKLPKEKQLTAIGPITQEAILSLKNLSPSL